MHEKKKEVGKRRGLGYTRGTEGKVLKRRKLGSAIDPHRFPE